MCLEPLPIEDQITNLQEKLHELEAEHNEWEAEQVRDQIDELEQRLYGPTNEEV